MPLARIDHLLEEKSLVGAPRIFRIVTAAFKMRKVAELAAKEIGFDASREQTIIRNIPACSRSLRQQKKQEQLSKSNMDIASDNQILKQGCIKKAPVLNCTSSRYLCLTMGVQFILGGV